MIDFDQVITVEMKTATLANRKTQIHAERDLRNNLDILFKGTSFSAAYPIPAGCPAGCLVCETLSLRRS